jgi:CSLREA domain-containing protein
VPARGYVKLAWPAAFTDVSSAAGEAALFADASLAANKMIDFACWGSALPSSRKTQAESVGKWNGVCANALTAGALHRLRATDGKTTTSYDTVSAPSPTSCVGIYTVSKTADTNDGVCDADCSLREAIAAANAAAGPDTIFVPAGTYILTSELAIADDLDLVGVSAPKSVLDGNASSRVLNVGAGETVNLFGLTVRSGSAPDSGGGIKSTGSLTITDGLVSGNTALLGGGVATLGGSLTLRNVTLSNNLATTDGGGLATSCSSCTVTLSDVTLSGNRASRNGGGLSSSTGATVTLANSTLTGNIADDDANQVGAGGGIAGSGGSVTLRNTVLAGNTDGTNLAPDCDNTASIVLSQGYNLVGVGTGCIFAQAAGDQIGVSPIDPKLGPLADNRGPTPTHGLLTGSPALDTANPTAGAFEATDQRSYLRPRDGNADTLAQCDIGSFETCSPVFSDVALNHTFKAYIDEAYCRGVTSGCAPNPLAFCPDNAVTRAQMAVFLVRSMGEQASGALSNAYFSDVVDDAIAPFINRMAELGITAGCGAGLYCPSASITRAQMAVFIIRAMEEKPSAVPYNQNFDDIANDSVAPFINRFFELGITGGCGTRLYCPAASVSRGQMAVFLVRSFFTY